MATITTYYRGDMCFESQLGNHRVVIDVPAGMGGQDRGPTPPELFIASLGSCVAALVAQYCGRSGVDATDMTVAVTFDKADDPSRLTNLRVRVELPHGQCADRQAAIHRVAEHCPVSETIMTLEGIDIEILGQEHLAALAV